MQAGIELRPNDTIVFIGDSITDAGRRQRAYRPLGYGYVHFAANWLLARHPEFDLGVINTGVSGNTIRDLSRRWEKDCLGHSPNILSILIGINDVWRQHTGRLNEAVLLDEYELTYKRLLSQARDRCDCQLVLMEPFMFCDDAENPMYNALRGFIRTTEDLANQFDAVLVPLQDSIDRKIRDVPSGRWSDDMVHPYLWAHAWIAQHWLEAVSL